MRMLLYLAMLLIGIVIGYKEISHKKLLESLDKFQMAALLVLLFIMGLRIGADPEVMASIQVIGLKSFIFAGITVFFSVFFVWLYTNKYMKGGHRPEKRDRI